MTDNDNKNKVTGKLQLKKTINAGQIKQSFSHGRSRSVSVEVKKKRSISGFSKNEKVEQPKSLDISLTQPEKIKREENSEIAVTENKNNSSIEKNDKKNSKKTIARNFLDNKTSEESNNEVTEKPKQPKFVKTPKSFENRRQGKLTISQALDDDNEKVRSLAAIKRAREKAKLRSVTKSENKENQESKERKKN